MERASHKPFTKWNQTTLLKPGPVKVQRIYWMTLSYIHCIVSFVFAREMGYKYWQVELIWEGSSLTSSQSQNSFVGALWKAMTFWKDLRYLYFLQKISPSYVMHHLVSLGTQLNDICMSLMDAFRVGNICLNLRRLVSSLITTYKAGSSVFRGCTEKNGMRQRSSRTRSAMLSPPDE